jgi:hypothetical protein
MAVALSTIAILIAASSFAYTFWAESPATRQADVAWSSKLTLEQAIVSHVYAFSTELKYLATGQGHLAPGSLISAATESLLQCLVQARSAGLLHVVSVCSRESKEDYLSEWLMLELHLQRNLAALNSTSRSGGGTVDVDPGRFSLTFSNDIRKILNSLSRRDLRRSLLRPLELTAGQMKAIAELDVTLQ